MASVAERCIFCMTDLIAFIFVLRLLSATLLVTYFSMIGLICVSPWHQVL